MCEVKFNYIVSNIFFLFSQGNQISTFVIVNYATWNCKNKFLKLHFCKISNIVVHVYNNNNILKFKKIYTNQRNIIKCLNNETNFVKEPFFTDTINMY